MLAAAHGQRHRVEIDRARAMQSEPRLGFEDAAHRLLDLRARDVARLHRRDDRRRGRRGIRRIENHVDAGLDRAHRGLARRRHLA